MAEDARPDPPVRSPQRIKERGQGTAEFVGALVLVTALIVGTVLYVPSVSSSVSEGVRSAVCSITSLVGIGCSGDDSSEERTAEDRIPPEQCVISSQGGQESVSVAVTFVEFGSGETWMIEQLGDGTYRLTRSKDGNIGATAGIGGGVTLELDGSTFGIEAAAGASAGLGIQSGEVFYASSEQEAQAILEAKRVADDQGIFHDWFGDNEYADREPDEWYVAGFEYAGGSVGATGLTESAQIAAALERQLGTRFKRNGERTDFYAVDMGLDMGIQSLGAELGDVQLAGNMTYAISYDSSGNPTSLTVTTETVADASSQFESSPDDPTRSTIAIEIPLATTTDREVATGMLLTAGLPGALLGTAVVTPQNLSLNPIENIENFAAHAADHGYLSQQTHAFSDSTNGFSASGKFLAELGVDIAWSSSTAQVIDSTYFDGTGWADRPGCV